MVVSWESAVDRGWLWEERSSPSVEDCRWSATGNAAAAVTVAGAVVRTVVATDEGAEASEEDMVEAMGSRETRESVASVDGRTAQSHQLGVRAGVSDGVDGVSQATSLNPCDAKTVRWLYLKASLGVGPGNNHRDGEAACPELERSECRSDNHDKRACE